MRDRERGRVNLSLINVVFFSEKERLMEEGGGGYRAFTIRGVPSK